VHPLHFARHSEVKTAQDEIRHLAFYDPLTELPIGGCCWSGCGRR